MNSRRLNLMLAISALVVSFAVVFLLGRPLASEDRGRDAEPTQPPVSSAWLEINIDDPRVGDPAPGILQVHDRETVDARICIDPAISAHWRPESFDGWANHFQQVCRRLDSSAAGAGSRIRLVRQ